MPRRQKNISNVTAVRIRELRKKNSLTQKDLADKLYKSESTIRMWELGKSEPDNETIRQLSEIFNVSSAYLLGELTIRSIVKPAKNAIMLRGRDGFEEESDLTDEQLELFKNMLKQFSDKKQN